MPKIHPTALVDPAAELADDVEVGPYSVIERDTSLGGGCRIGTHAVIARYTRMGRNNVVHPFCVLGGDPQDLKFDPAQKSHVVIGDDNVFREGVTISRGTGEGTVTTIGSKTYWMAGSHAGHNATTGDGVILVNGAALAGHCRVANRALLSAHVVIHQFCWVGELAMFQGNSGASTHVPPYVVVVSINRVKGLNVVGLHRAPEITDEDRRQIKEAFHMLYRSELSTSKALERMDQCQDWGQPAHKFREFIRTALSAPAPFARAICPAAWQRE